MERQFDPDDPEWMDRPQPISPELVSDLRNLRSLNRYFGSYRLLRHFLQRWIRPNDKLRIVDLATGSGDLPRLVVKHARTVGASVTVDAVDLQPSTLEVARGLSEDFPEIRYHCADIQQFGDNDSCDIVLFTLALHHFSAEEAVALLRRCRQLSRARVLVADLCRSRLTTIGIDLLTTFVYREAMTRNDARASIRRAFSFREMSELARAADWQNFGHRRFPIGRQAIWLEK